ncbi:MAG: IclR family transcriptional regulator [Acidimicrobiia bacterium]|nr:IclR family transcriptional regulator [Acidimicrobiia bacterium]
MSNVQSIERAFLLLEVLASDPLGVSELAARSGLPKSTVARLISTLESLGAVERSNEGLLTVGTKISELTGSTSTGPDLIARVRPHLVSLSREVDEDAGLSVPDGYLVHYINQADSDNPVQIRDWTGELVPMHCVPSGLVLLASWPSERLDRFLARRLTRYTHNTVIDPYAIRQRLTQIRADGYCWVYEEFAEGINSVAAPVYDRDQRAVAAIHVHGPAYRFPSPERAVEIAELVKAKAAQVSRDLAHLAG